MMNQMEPSSPQKPVVTSRVLWIIAALGLMGLLFFLVSVFYEKIDRPRDYVMTGSALFLFVSGLVGFVLARVGKVTTGVWLVLAANLWMAMLVGVVLRGLAPALGSYALITSLVLIYIGVPTGYQRRAVIVTFGLVLLMALIEFWNPDFRGSSPVFVDMGSYFSSVLWIVFVVLLLVEVRTRQISVEGRVGVGFMIVMYISVLVALMSVHTFRSYNASSDKVILETNRSLAANQMQAAMWRLKETEMAIVFTPSSPASENEYLFSRSELEKAISNWSTLMREGENINAALVDNIQSDVQNLLVATDQAVQMAANGQIVEARQWELDSVAPVAAALGNKIDNAIDLADTRSQATQEALRALIMAGLLRSMGVALFALVIGGILSLAVGASIVRPIVELSQVAISLGRGERSLRVQTAPDEIGMLGMTMNNTVSQLDMLYSNLEQQVADRTRALQVSTEVSRRLSTILNQEQLVREVVEQLQKAFNYYHVHIYLFDESRQNLVMAGGTGDAGREMLARGHKIMTGRGLVGRAAETNQPVLVPDTSRDPNWLPNPLLPNTRSEVAVPIALGDTVLGVLDVQQDMVDGLKQEDSELIQSIANQVANALQNARAYAQAQHQVEFETLLSDIGQKIQRADSIDDVLQVAARELGIALGAKRSSVELRSSSALAKTNKNEPVQL